MAPRSIFLAHASEDKAAVRKLYVDLKARGFDPWLDEKDLLPGQIWKEEIPKAIRQAGVFLACLSSRSVSKVGYLQNEFRDALSAFGERPPGSIYLIPVRLEDCQVPDLRIPDRGLSLRDLQWVDLWEEGGVDHLVSGLEAALGASTPLQPSRQKPRGNGTIQPPAMVIIPSGCFWMGSSISEANRDEDEGPRHKVTIRHPFAMAIHPVTFDEYDRFASATGRELPGDERWGGGRRPVINVTWKDAKAYTKWLSMQIRESYRLPSESEWEYVCRAGTSTLYSWGNEIKPENANWAGSLNNRTVEVGSYSPNPWGLCDMHGNVREWLEDVWHESYEGAPIDGSAWTSGEGERRVVRGGAWDDGSRILRAACRNGRPCTEYRTNYIGFRLARTLSVSDH